MSNEKREQFEKYKVYLASSGIIFLAAFTQYALSMERISIYQISIGIFSIFFFLIALHSRFYALYCRIFVDKQEYPKASEIIDRLGERYERFGDMFLQIGATFSALYVFTNIIYWTCSNDYKLYLDLTKIKIAFWALGLAIILLQLLLLRIDIHVYLKAFEGDLRNKPNPMITPDVEEQLNDSD